MSFLQLEFAWPWVFLCTVLPVISYLFISPARESNQNALLFPFTQMLASMQADSVSKSSALLKWLGILAWLLLVIAAARPQWVGDSIQVPVSGRSLMLAVDISGSMENEDMVINRRAVDRLTAVKSVAGEFIEKREGDYLGLILFGSKAYLQSPLSYDRKTIRILLNEAVTRLAGENTAIGDAIGLAIKRLKKQPQQNRVLVLLTDGANTAGSIEPLKAADLAASESIKIYTIGVGDDSVRSSGIFGLRLRKSDLDESTLKAIASKTGGQFFRARDIAELQQIYQILDEIEPVTDENQSFRPITELYQWPLAMAFMLALIITGLRRKQHG
ncbi:MAG: VWA domain-containing protein [Gammaproteobacteria bacterium]|nr:VWA domain-containing protein [Gammaproteobacteria bacterium]NNJ91105.1 VWA domain-containing protein [Gammaproteobacteria bacterium]